MSNLLEQAIVDAKALKEAAMKNAESSILEKYSAEMKEVVDSLLSEEEDPFALDALGEDLAEGEEDPDAVVPTVPAAEGVCPCPDIDNDDDPDAEKERIDIDLGRIGHGSSSEKTDATDALEEEIEIDFDMLEQQILAESDAETDEDSEETTEETTEEATGETAEELTEGDDEDNDIADDLVDKIIEKLVVDMDPQKSGWMERPIADIHLAIDQAEATEADENHEADNMINSPRLQIKRQDEALELLNKENEELTEKVIALSTNNDKAMTAVLKLKEKLEEVNLSNAKLLYTNRILTNSSLNERQRDQIVESLSNATTVQEAKVIYDTLQSTVSASPSKRKPETLSEVVTKRSSVIRSQKRETNNYSEAAYTRMKKLAGL